MSRPKRKSPKGRTEKASSRIFYRRPRDMFADFMWSGAGLTVIPLAVFAVTLYAAHGMFIRMCG